jgi:group I intron endonuclease
MYIYKTTCIINNIIYIGQCSKTPDKSKKYLGGGRLIELAIKKYGKENFIKEILKDNLQNQKELDIWEQIFIKKFNSTNRDIGYNILPGTSNGFGHVNPATLPEVKIKMSESSKGKYVKPHTEEFKINMRKIMLENNPMKGRFGEKHHLYGKVHKNKGKKNKVNEENSLKARQRMIEFNKNNKFERNVDGTFKSKK